jgi:uncharacterized phiE125 gp8 family phage protein
MPAFLRRAPLTEPLTLAQAKAHLRIGEDAEDETIVALISAARAHIEQAFSLALIAQSWTMVLDRWPRVPEITLPLWPVISIDKVKVVGEEGAALIIDEAHYVSLLAVRPARLLRRPDRHWPQPGRSACGIEIEFTGGFGSAAADVPEPIRQALKIHLAALYDDREGGASPGVPAAAAALLSPYAAVGL